MASLTEDKGEGGHRRVVNVPTQNVAATRCGAARDRTDGRPDRRLGSTRSGIGQMRQVPISRFPVGRTASLRNHSLHRGCVSGQRLGPC